LQEEKSRVAGMYLLPEQLLPCGGPAHKWCSIAVY
jgi:hypothetical protein